MRPIPMMSVPTQKVIKLNDDLFVTRVILRHIFMNSLSLATAVELLEEIFTGTNARITRVQIAKNIRTVLETDIRKNPSAYNLAAEDVRQMVYITTLLR